MNPVKEAIGQIRALCRQYPDKLTAHELVGKTYLSLDAEPGIEGKTSLLVGHLNSRELAKLIDAARTVFRACDSFTTVQGFNLGAVVFPVDKDTSSSALDDRLVPGDFVKQLMHGGRSATGRSA